MSQTATYPLDRVRNAREPRQQKKSFVPLDGYQIGLEIDWGAEILRYFLYKDKRHDVLLKSEWVSFYDKEKGLRAPLHELILTYYKSINRTSKLSDYTKMELNIPVGHLYYHIWAGTLRKVLSKEIMYS